MLRTRTSRAFFSTFFLSASIVAARDCDAQWTGFRGPLRNGIAKDAKPPLDWSDDKNLSWKLALPGPGSSSPMIHGKHLVVLCYTGYGDHLDDGGEPEKLVRHVICIDRSSGKQMWSKALKDPLSKEARQVQLKNHGFATPTPTTDGELIYAYLGHVGLVALDFAGEIKWQAKLGEVSKEQGQATNKVAQGGRTLSLRWGSASSPLLFENFVIVNASEQSNSIRAYDKRNGDFVWKYESANLEGCATSPTLAGADTKEVLIIMLGGEVWGLDPRNGKRIWRVPTESRGGISPTPVCDEEIAYTFGGSGQSYAIRFARDAVTDAGDAIPEKEDAKRAKKDDATSTDENPAVDATQLNKMKAPPKHARVLWRSKNLGIPSPVLFDGKLLLVEVNGTATCLNAKDGKIEFNDRLEGRTSQIYASPLVANKRLYVVSRKRGTFVYSADGKFQLLAHNKLADRGPFNASPVAVGTELYLRSDTHLYCFTSRS